jgi:hypothetical protein
MLVLLTSRHTLHHYHQQQQQQLRPKQHDELSNSDNYSSDADQTENNLSVGSVFFPEQVAANPPILYSVHQSIVNISNSNADRSGLV